jgi:hypothetical protein
MMEPGQNFETMQHFRDAMQDWAITDHFNYYVEHSTSEQSTIKCRAQEQYPFVVRCAYNSAEDHIIITSMHGVHTCLGSALIQRSIMLGPALKPDPPDC